MSVERRQRLDELGFVWDPLSAKWEKGFNHLKRYLEREGTLWVAIVGGGAVTFIWAAIEGKSPFEVWVYAAEVGAACAIIACGLLLIWRLLCLPPVSFEIIYNPNDEHFVKPLSDKTTRYSVGLRILTSHSIDYPNIRAQ
jgi:hypothetical protein